MTSSHEHNLKEYSWSIFVKSFINTDYSELFTFYLKNGTPFCEQHVTMLDKIEHVMLMSCIGTLLNSDRVPLLESDTSSILYAFSDFLFSDLVRDARTRSHSGELVVCYPMLLSVFVCLHASMLSVNCAVTSVP